MALLDRRRLLLTSVAAGVGLSVRGGWRSAFAAGAEPRLNDDGLYEQPFFVQSFLDLGEDLQTAADAGKRFAVMWELRGCPYCKETHFVNFADPEIREFVSSNFEILQLNLVGSREVTDFDGEALEERQLARKWGIRFTPTTMFFAESLEAVGGQPGDQAEVARMPGYFRPPHFLAMYRFVQEKAYETSSFNDFLQNTAMR